MADKKKPAVAANTGGTAQKFTVERLRVNCRKLFGVSDSTFAGATNGMSGLYTIEEMKSHIEAWGREGVK